MGTKRGLERIVFFTDAVTAIAITLLILPLVEIITSLGNHSTESLDDLFSAHWPQVLGFVISFAVIARLWVAHHAIFDHVDGYNWLLLNLTLLWAFTIVLLPLPTAITAAFSPSSATIGFYVGTMTANSILLTAMTVVVYKNPKLELASNPVTRKMIRGSAMTTGAFAVALVLGVAIPAVSYYPLFLIAIVGWADSLVRHTMAKREAHRHPPVAAAAKR